MKISSNRPGALADTTVPILFRIKNPEDQISFSRLLESEPGLNILDQIRPQLKDLVKLENPEKALNENEYLDLIVKKLNGTDEKEYGVWVYYPWNKTIIHMLDDEEFIRVRTIRNAYKITFEEQALLRTKKIGIIGLSVGQSVALTIAIERGAGEIRIADFDTLELSNLNRIRTGIHNIGLKKTTVVAREIAEIDPFLKVICFSEGVTRENISDFFDDGGMLDLLVEECDSVDVKILAREEAKKRRIPVIMDTSDRGMLDIERFDLEPDYPILHGLIDPKITFDFLSSLTTSEEKLPYIIPILGADNLSVRLKASGLEVGKTITTWPQLGSDVVLGGALCANASRRILLGDKIISKRTYIDLDEQILSESAPYPKHKQIDVDDGELLIDKVDNSFSLLNLPTTNDIGIETLNTIIADAVKASSPGNSQKWKWYYKNGNLLLLIDKSEEKGFADNFSFGTLIGFGCALENLRLSAAKNNLNVNVKFPNSEILPQLASIITFSPNKSISNTDLKLYQQINKRCCNRINVPYKALSNENVYALNNLELPSTIQFDLILDRDKIGKIGTLVCKGDRIRMTNLYGHKDFFSHEVRWTRKESESKRDGLDITLFDLNEVDKTGLKLSKDARAIEFLNEIGGGKGFERISAKNFDGASALGVISIENYDRQQLIEAGIAIERLWLHASELKLGIQPYTVLQMLFSRLHEDSLNYISNSEKEQIIAIKEEFEEILPSIKFKKSVFLFRITMGAPDVEFSFRKPVSEKTVIR